MKNRLRPYVCVPLAMFVLAYAAIAGEKEQISIEQAGQSEVVRVGDKYLFYLIRDVILATETARIYCDSAALLKGENVRLKGHVRIDDTLYHLAADSTFYDIETGTATAWGSEVVLWSFNDSVYAVGTQAFYDRENKYFRMNERPLLYLKYPDSANMVEIIADSIEYSADSAEAVAIGNVLISSSDLSTSSGKAVMNTKTGQLALTVNPTVRRRNSEMSGSEITVSYENDLITSIDVVDSANGIFKEPVDSLESDYDESILSGERILLSFEDGLLSDVLCCGQAYSWYYPSVRGGNEFHENSVSGDTIKFRIENESLKAIDVVGSSIGTYVTGRLAPDDSLSLSRPDTIDYQATYIKYDLNDSLITLREAGQVTSGTMSLVAHEVLFDTRRRVIEAYSASIEPDSTVPEDAHSSGIQPNAIPVVLSDKDDVVYGDYLEYSIDTKKGRIVHSKSSYEAGFYYGGKLFREQQDIFYIQDGRYTTCDLDEPHFHFRSGELKLIEGDKLIARPVVFYLGQLPLIYLPYYVFPLKRGRHSGFLPFTFGNFERGVRFVRNVGYYWAASEYWDWQGSFDYYENRRTFSLNSRLSFAKRYVIENTYLSGSYTKQSKYDNAQGLEGGTANWVVRGRYNHIITPSLKVTADGSFQSSKDYYTEYSTNLDERLNREVKSQASIRKEFGRSSVLTATFNHTVNLDKETRTDKIPGLKMTLPTIYLFGNGYLNEQGGLSRTGTTTSSFVIRR